MPRLWVGRGATFGVGAAALVMYGAVFASAQETPDEVEPVDTEMEIPVAEADVSCLTPEALYGPACQARVIPYTPAYQLWSDDADKERFIFLPKGAKIDNTNPDAWVFPKGTVLYKTFLRDNQKMETRIIEKIADAPGFDSWDLRAYAWNDDQTTTHLADGDAASRTLKPSGHYIPAKIECETCHSMGYGGDPIIGFSAVQLNDANRPELKFTLTDARAYLTDTNAALESAATVPGDSVAQEAIGHLHGNCAHCHGNGSMTGVLNLRWSVADAFARLEDSIATNNASNVEDSAVFKNALCKKMTARSKMFAGETRLKPANPAELESADSNEPYGALVKRMNLRKIDAPKDLAEHIAALSAGPQSGQMPPLATGLKDKAGMDKLRAWSKALGTQYVCDGETPTKKQ